MKIESFKSYNTVWEWFQTFFFYKANINFYYISEIVCAHIFIPIIKKSQIQRKASYKKAAWWEIIKYFFVIFLNYFNWRIITLQYCGGFCHTLTWISHGCTCVPHPETPSHLPSHPIPLGCPIAPALTSVSCIELGLVIYFTYGNIHFNAILSNHPILAFSHRVQKSVLYVCVSFAVLHIRSS